MTGGDAGDNGKGNSMGAHLHFELYKNGAIVDPMQHLGSEVGDYQGDGGSSAQMVVATPQMLNKMIDLLKAFPPFFLAALLLAIVPGQGVAMVLRQSIIGGKRPAFRRGR